MLICTESHSRPSHKRFCRKNARKRPAHAWQKRVDNSTHAHTNTQTPHIRACTPARTLAHTHTEAQPHQHNHNHTHASTITHTETQPHQHNHNHTHASTITRTEAQPHTRKRSYTHASAVTHTQKHNHTHASAVTHPRAHGPTHPHMSPHTRTRVHTPAHESTHPHTRSTHPHTGPFNVLMNALAPRAWWVLRCQKSLAPHVPTCDTTGTGCRAEIRNRCSRRRGRGKRSNTTGGRAIFV